MIGTLENIFDYEQVEDAWIAILGKSDRCFPEFIDETKDASIEPYIEVTLTNVVPTGHEYPWKERENLPAGWKATLISRIVTRRGVNSDKHREMVGRVRLTIQRYRELFKESILPHHQVMLMREATLTRGVDELDDWSEIHAEVTFYVRDNAWPVE